MKHYQKLPKPGSDPHSETCSDFEFPTASLGVQQNDVVFCGKVITDRVESSLALHQNKRQSNRFVAGLRSPSGRESQCHKSGNGNDRRKKSCTRMFGTLKFPLQMELSDIKMRQERMEPPGLLKLPIEDDIRDSCWQMIQSLRRKGTLLSALKASFGCIRIV